MLAYYPFVSIIIIALLLITNIKKNTDFRFPQTQIFL